MIKICADVPINKVTRKHFREIKGVFIKSGLALTTINERLRFIKQLFEYAFDQELIDREQSYEISTVKVFKRSDAIFKEKKEVRAVPLEVVEKTLPFLPGIIADMVRLQLYAGMLAGEVCSITLGEIDRSGGVWIYAPVHHKTEYHGKTRTIFIGPQGQAVLAKYTDEAEPDKVLFSPAESEAKRKKERRARRKSKVQPSQRDRSKPTAKRKPGSRYTKDSYGRAISRGCHKAVKAGVLKSSDVWHSHQLRHTAGTLARRVKGLDGAQVFLGHSSAKVTEIYAEKDVSLGYEIAAKIG